MQSRNPWATGPSGGVEDFKTGRLYGLAIGLLWTALAPLAFHPCVKLGNAIWEPDWMGFGTGILLGMVSPLIVFPLGQLIHFLIARRVLGRGSMRFKGLRVGLLLWDGSLAAGLLWWLFGT